MKAVRILYAITLALTVLCYCDSLKAGDDAQQSGDILLAGRCGVSNCNVSHAVPRAASCGPVVSQERSAPTVSQNDCTHCNQYGAQNPAPQYAQGGSQFDMQQSGAAFPGLRRAFAQPQQSVPAMGMRPLIAPRRPSAPHAAIAGPVGYGAGAGYPGYGAGGGYPFDAAYPKGHCAFPRLQKMFCPDQCFMSTSAPAAPMKTYTTRGPRDFFLNDNPSSIGY